ncbi:MAG: PAS domain S-box protein [Polyangiaceae bacterium]|nr:PAS domain S-box protein [Polyangiaceae bacterium]
MSGSPLGAPGRPGDTPWISGIDARLLLENASDVVALTDAEGVIRYVNPAIERTLGYPPGEVVGLSALDFLHADDLLEAREGFLRAARGEPPARRIVARCRHRDGTVRFVEVIGKRVRDAEGSVVVILHARDITPARELEAIFRALPDICFRLDGEGRIVSSYAAKPAHLYAAPERFLGRRPDEVLPPDAGATVARAIEEAHRLAVVARASYALPMPGGERRYEGRFIPFEEGHTIAVIQDVTDRWRAEEVLRRGEERSRESQKMEAIGRLAGGIAHDFNNLLMAILGYGELLSRRLGEAHPLHRDVLEIKKAGERAAALTRQLLAFSRRQVLTPVLLDLNAVVLDMQDMLRRLIGARIDLRTITAPNLPKVRADRGQIEQVLMNLVVNARDAMDRGGTLIIETSVARMSAPPATEDAEAPPAAAVPHALLSVSDTGCGIDAETRSHLFEPFFTTKENGTGLGLATVYGIVNQSGGRVTVESEVGRGTTFRVILPIARDDAAPPAPADQAPAAASAPGREAILVVEDDAAVRRLIVQVLERLGYRVTATDRGEAALALVARDAGAFDLLLTDVIMPGMTGKELAARAVAHAPSLRVLYMSGYTDDEITGGDIARALLQKPFSPDALAQRVRSALDRR